ncbi:MAG: hypothetical protein M0C28_44610 [Candidatus Moduliflexus flocculans]|nr:hypothetical protein [Candidatus Moduliflexus flocculans]
MGVPARSRSRWRFAGLVIFRQSAYPRRYGWIFVALTVFPAEYILLLEFGPDAATTPAGLVIQATGQKVIVYVSILARHGATVVRQHQIRQARKPP